MDVFRCFTECGIPGIEMTGQLDDWLQLKEKTLNLQDLLQPVLLEIKLLSWFESTMKTLDQLIHTFQG